MNQRQCGVDRNKYKLKQINEFIGRAFSVWKLLQVFFFFQVHFKPARLRNLRHKTSKDIFMPTKKLELLFCRWSCPEMNNQKPMKSFSLHSFAFYCIHMLWNMLYKSCKKKLSHFRRLRENWSINESFLILPSVFLLYVRLNRKQFLQRHSRRRKFFDFMRSAFFGFSTFNNDGSSSCAAFLWLRHLSLDSVARIFLMSTRNIFSKAFEVQIKTLHVTELILKIN